MQERATRPRPISRRADALLIRRIQNETGYGPVCPRRAEGGVDELNRWLGRREAFGLMADAVPPPMSMHEAHSRQQTVLGRAENWSEFCVKYLHMGKATPTG